jgi:molecular chaperone HscC
MTSSDLIIGIDLGTTNSLCAVWRDGRAELIPNAIGDHLTPSVVGLDDHGRIIVGRVARERLVTHPQLSIAVFKRYMGSEREFKLGKKAFRAEELSALVLKSLKVDAERHLGVEIERAVITVPAYFSDAQRKATRIAGELAGLDVACLLNEPTAAALAYGLHNEQPESKFLVFDLGGGTFDVSILELFEGVMEVRASAGDNFLGGEDFVGVLVNEFWRSAGDDLRSYRDHPALAAAVARQAELVKRKLSEQAEAELKVDWNGRSHACLISEERFLGLAEPLLMRLRTPVERALRDARIRASELDQVVLAGGATRMPLVRKLVARLFGRMPCMSLHPDEAVALGAAVQGGLKMRDAALSEIVMTDVCPYTLGIEVAEAMQGGGWYAEGRYLPIIERNTVVPVSREHVVSPVSDNQKVLTVNIYQGEARLVKDNVFLGSIEIPLPPGKASEVFMSVRFTYDASGLLEAEMAVRGTDEKYRLVIEDNPGVLTPEEIEHRFAELAALKIHPREQMINTSLIARGERLYEESLGDLRERVRRLLSEFESALNSQSPERIDSTRQHVEKAFNEVEGVPWL